LTFNTAGGSQVSVLGNVEEPNDYFTRAIVTKNGAGTVNLYGRLAWDNLYLDIVTSTINAGTLAFINATYASFDKIVINSGGTLLLNNIDMTPWGITLNGNGADGTGALITQGDSH